MRWMLTCPTILLPSNKHIEKSLFYDLLHSWLNDGLLTSTGDKWRGRRKILTPAFHFNVLEEFVDTFVEHTDRLVENLLAEAQSGDVVKELLPIFSKFTLGTICETAMGTTFDEKNKIQNEYRKAIHDIGNLFYWRATKPWLKSDFIYSMTTRGKQQAKIIKNLQDFTMTIIEERKQYHDSTGGKYLNEFSAEDTENKSVPAELRKSRRRLAFLDLLIAASRNGQGIDDHGIQEEVATFVFEGHDTTAAALLFLSLVLAEHTDIQNRCREEIQEVMRGKVSEKMNIRDVQKLNYLERCIKESLRLYPSVPTIGRKVIEDLQLKTCFVPKGTIINIHLFDTHRDPNYWPRPNVFDPDRFLPENSKGRHPFAYVPFSAGPRNCIGQKFAMLELKTLIAGLLLNFYLEPMELAAHVRIVPDLVLRTAHPVPLKFVPIRK
ncbi:cytochrome P450 4C1 isoform X2 [Diachasma alloeum]|uniref:cytochrome P450 4C1 isoform X2 n=1 Tax=Diachasma alloeum TaxID=454923 RepID=UPI00073842F1|nr:cytochrome P450 4C1 isoform X2 [Diachasma alloeum]